MGENRKELRTRGRRVTKGAGGSLGSGVGVGLEVREVVENRKELRRRGWRVRKKGSEGGEGGVWGWGGKWERMGRN